MKRTDADGHVSNLYTDGNPSLGVVATVLNASAMNAIQEEICNVIEGAGITLDPLDSTQLKQAIQNGGGSLNFSLANNQVAAANVTGLLLDKTKTRAATIPFLLHRQTDTPLEYDVVGVITLYYKPVADSWNISVEFKAGDADDVGIVFSVTSAGQIQYTSTNLAGANYSGYIRVGAINKIK
jgi:hypothetical protein